MLKFLDPLVIISNIPVGNMFVYHGNHYIQLHLNYDSVYQKFFFEEIEKTLFDNQQEAILFASKTIGEPRLYIEHCGGCREHPERFMKLSDKDFEKIHDLC